MDGQRVSPQPDSHREGARIEVRGTVCDICNAGCWIDASIQNDRVIKVEGCKMPSFGNGYLCAKGHASRQYIYHEDRIKTPLRRVGARGEGKFEPISWEKAFSETAARLNTCKQKNGVDSVAFYAGSSQWYHPFLHRLAHSFGTLNYGSDPSISAQSAVMAGKLSAGTTAEPDIANAGVLVMWGCNQYCSGNITQPPALIQKRRGMRIIVVDPRTTVSSYRLADLHLHIRPGTDAALAHGLARIFIHSNWIDEKYISEHVHGFGEYASYVEQFDSTTVAAITGISERKIQNAARLIMRSGPLTVWKSSGGITQQKNGMQTCRAIDALCAITGSFDRRGGLIPNRSGSAAGSTKAGLDMEGFICETRPKGTLPSIGSRRFPLWAKYSDEFQAMDLSRQILSQKPYPVRSVCAFGMNADLFPNNQVMHQALESLDFFVDTDLFLTPTACYADIVFPACSSFERSELRNTEAGLYYTRPVIPPLAQARSDVDIICALANALGLSDDTLSKGPQACYERMMNKLPVSFDLVKNADRPVPLPMIRKPEPGEYTCGGYLTPTGKYELKATVIENCGVPKLVPLPEYVSSLDDADQEQYPFILSLGNRIPGAMHSRMHRVAWVRALWPGGTADIYPEDAQTLGIDQGDRIELSTPYGTICVNANLSILVRSGTVNLPSDYEEGAANSIVAVNHLDPYSGFPGYRAMCCAIRRKENGNSL